MEELCKSRGIRCSHRVTKTQLMELLEDVTGEANWGYMTTAQLMGICKGCNIQTPKAKNTKGVMIGMLEEYDRVNETVG